MADAVIASFGASGRSGSKAGVGVANRRSSSMRYTRMLPVTLSMTM